MEEVVGLFLKLGLALVLSGIIGIEREVTGHKAGMRTLILVGIGAASLVMLVERLDIPKEELGRIIAGVATGIGFLGAGAIIKEGINVKGLTTAATIWVTASIGMTVGTGAYYIGFITFAFTLIVLTIFGVLERKFKLKPKNGILRLVLSRDVEIPRKELKRLQGKGVGFQRIMVDNPPEGIVITIDMELPRGIRIVDFLEKIKNIRGIKEVTWEDLELKGPSNYLDSFQY
jgi:putative Mg2+ transporter-C (MgtC) family protein